MTDSGKKKVDRATIDAMLYELKLLDVLNSAAFKVFFDNTQLMHGVVSVHSDRTNSKRDKCRTPKQLKRRLQGDFCLIRQLNNSLFVVVGDAFGHYSYALGLKLFISMALDRIFLEDGAPTLLSPSKVIERLIEFFYRVARGSNDRDELVGGADIVVLRFGPKGDASFASAGLPFYLLDDGLIQSFGDWSPLKGVHFPPNDSEIGPPVIANTTFSVGKTGFIAIVTDGFEELRRSPCGSTEGNVSALEQFGRSAVEAALLQGAAQVHKSRKGKRAAGELLARTLIKRARSFRHGHSVPDIGEDDRQIVIIDLEMLWKLLSGCQEAAIQDERIG